MTQVSWSARRSPWNRRRFWGGEEATGAGVDPGESSAAGGTGLDTADGGSASTSTAENGATKGTVQRFVVRGGVPVENCGELFRCFVGPAARMNLKKLELGVQFEMELSEGYALSKNDPALKAKTEAARQLGLSFEVGG